MEHLKAFWREWRYSIISGSAFILVAIAMIVGFYFTLSQPKSNFSETPSVGEESDWSDFWIGVNSEENIYCIVRDTGEPNVFSCDWTKIYSNDELPEDAVGENVNKGRGHFDTVFTVDSRGQKVLCVVMGSVSATEMITCDWAHDLSETASE